VTYNVTSGYSILDGSCEITGTGCASYTSTSHGAGKVLNLPSPSGWTLHFSVSFSGVARTYVITANPNPSGSGYTGHANEGDKKETWAATAVQPAVAAKGY